MKYFTGTKNTFAVIFIYFTLLLILDYSGVMNLYGQNFVRRLINMYRRRDELTYKNKLNPFCVSERGILNQDDLRILKSINIPDKIDVSVISRTNTTTHAIKNFTPTEKASIQNICEKVKTRYEDVIGKELYHLGKDGGNIFVYHGKDSKHLWHVDPKNISEIYNTIICIKRVGDISPLQYKNEKGEINSIHFEEGDAAFFNGGTTEHQVPPNKDDNSERTVLSLVFTSDDNLNKDENFTKSMCTYVEGGSNHLNIIKLILAIFFINLILSVISGIERVSYTFLSILFILVLFAAKYVPLLNICVGSGRSSSILKNAALLPLFVLTTLSIKGGTLFYVYFLLSDVFFPRSWVEYH